MRNNRFGSSLIEVLLAFGLLAIFLPALATGLVASREGRATEKQRLAAVALLREEEEALRNVRESGWANFAGFSGAGAVHATTSGSTWILQNGVENIDGYARHAEITSVSRDTNGTIVTSGGADDPSTKKVVISVSWTKPSSGSVSVTKFMTRYLDNLSYTETTQTQFNAGSKTNVKVQAASPALVSDDGEIVLDQTGGYGDWCTPSLTFTATDLPKNGVANAVSVIQGQGAAGTGDNASGVSFANLTISDPAFPTAPTATVSGTFDNYKTNGVFTETNYAYLATDTNGKQGVIINLNSVDPITQKYNEAGSLNLQSSSINGKSVYVSNNYAYLTGSNGRLYIFDINNRSGSHIAVGSVGLAGVGNKVIVVGNNAYVAVNTTSNQLQIVDVSNPANPTVSASNNITVNGLQAQDIYANVSQNRAYLVTSQSSTKPEFFLINLATKSVVGSYDTSSHGDMSPKGVVAVSGARVIIVGTGGEEYQVLKASDESNPTYCGGLNIDSGVNGVSTVFTSAQRAYSYIITGDASAEFKIIEGGPGEGNGNYVPSGTFISKSFGPIVPATAFNRFVANVAQPVVNDLLLQVAVADAVSGSCSGANYTFLGRDRTSGVIGVNSYFSTNVTGSASISGSVPFGIYSPNYINPGKCFKYKVVLTTTDSTLTPVLKDFTVNYSP